MSTKNVTTRLSDQLIEASKDYAENQGESLNEVIREFLENNLKKLKNYLTTSERVATFSEENAGYGGGAKFDRDKANES
jgi:predicted house-cleaning noncanonical NTP pyrophosphatase (MazG superfamily)